MRSSVHLANEHVQIAIEDTNATSRSQKEAAAPPSPSQSVFPEQVVAPDVMMDMLKRCGSLLYKPNRRRQASFFTVDTDNKGQAACGMLIRAHILALLSSQFPGRIHKVGRGYLHVARIHREAHVLWAPNSCRDQMQHDSRFRFVGTAFVVVKPAMYDKAQACKCSPAEEARTCETPFHTPPRSSAAILHSPQKVRRTTNKRIVVPHIHTSTYIDDRYIQGHKPQALVTCMPPLYIRIEHAGGASIDMCAANIVNRLVLVPATSSCHIKGGLHGVVSPLAVFYSHVYEDVSAESPGRRPMAQTL
jgi:hypothetical protein